MSTNNNLVDSDKDTRLIEIDVGYDVFLPVTINSDSGLLYEVSELTNFNLTQTSQRVSQAADQLVAQQGQTRSIKLRELFPKVNEVTLSYYIYFLRGKELTIVTRAELIDCFNFYSLLGDTNFFECLLKSLFKLWTVLSPALYSGKIIETIEWEIWLRCPYQVLPDSWLQDRKLMTSWRERDNNKYVMLNGDEVFDFEDVKVEEIAVNDDLVEDDEGAEQAVQQRQVNITKVTSYTRQHDAIEVAHKTVQEMVDGTITGVDDFTSYNGLKQGKSSFSYSFADSTDTTYDIFIAGKTNGVMELLKDGRPKTVAYYIDGYKEGLETSYSRNGKLERVTHWLNSQRHGLETFYFISASPSLYSVALWQDNEMVERTNYKKNGHYIKSSYIQNGKIAVLPFFYKIYDDQNRLRRVITNPLHKNVVKRDIEYDDQGKVTSDKNHVETETFNPNNEKWKQH